MSSSDDLIRTLEREHERLGEVLRTIGANPQWMQGAPNSLDLSALQQKAEMIRNAIDGVERLVDRIGKPDAHRT